MDYTREISSGETPELIKKRSEEFIKRNEALGKLWNKPEALRAVCAQYPYYTRVRALQRDSEMAKSLLDADYLLKKVSAGVGELKVKDPRLNPIKVGDLIYAKILDGKASQAEKDADAVVSMGAKSTTGKLTFQPGRMSYIRDENSIFIDCVQVLLTASSWNIHTLEKVENPIFRDFAYTWTNRMEEIIRTEPMLRRMQDIFRMFALARILEQNHELMHLSDRQVIESYLVPMITVPDHYDTSVVMHSIHSKRPFTWSTCGGVTVRYQNTAPSSDVVTSDVRNDIALSGRKAIDTMNSCTGSCWNVE
jgi:hypothetical protein